MSSDVLATGSGEVFAALRNAWKFYGEFAALRDATLSLRRGEVHMLLGENGAGKSTMVSLLIGTNRPDRGSVEIRGKTVDSMSPAEARRAGINAVLQDFSLAPSLTVAENYFLGRELGGIILSRRRMRDVAAEAVRRLGVNLDVDAPVSTLSRAEQQVLEIVRALGGTPGLLILDEPTATLSHGETDRLFEIVDQLRTESWAVLYITHRMEEIRRLGDTVTVLRDGQVTGVHAVADTSNDQLVQEMVGRPLTTLHPDINRNAGEIALELKSVTVAGKMRDVSLQVRYGEIVGVGGLVGSGKSSIARAVFGLEPIASGQVLRNGEAVHQFAPAAMLDSGLIYLPQDRRGEALSLNRSIADNMSVEVLKLADFNRAGFVRVGPVERLVTDLIARLALKPPEPSKAVQDLSGGNQQKVVLGRALSRPRQVYIFEEPTAGIDVGARLDFYNQLKLLCEGGAAVVLITSDLQELLHLSHRIYVLHGGEMAAEIPAEHATEEYVVACCFGEAQAADLHRDRKRVQ